MSSEILKMIDTLVEQKTFGLDAVEAIQKMRSHALALETSLESAQKSLAISQAALIASNAGRDKALTELHNMDKRDADVSLREQKQTRLECDVEKHAALAAQGREFVSLIFRNQTIMTSAMRAVASSTNAYPVQAPESETTTVS